MHAVSDFLIGGKKPETHAYIIALKKETRDCLLYPFPCHYFVKSGTGASLGRSISVDPASPRLHVILLV